jgi:hypothetical protein
MEVMWKVIKAVVTTIACLTGGLGMCNLYNHCRTEEQCRPKLWFYITGLCSILWSLPLLWIKPEIKLTNFIDSWAAWILLSQTAIEWCLLILFVPLRRKIRSYKGKTTLVDDSRIKGVENWLLGIGLVTLTIVEVSLIVIYCVVPKDNKPFEISAVVFCGVVEIGIVIMGIVVLKDLSRMQQWNPCFTKITIIIVAIFICSAIQIIVEFTLSEDSNAYRIAPCVETILLLLPMFLVHYQ